MSLDHAILGLLNIYPMTGYDLKTQAFDATVQHFWPAAQSQIYRTLDRMAEKEWVTPEIEHQEGKPDRKVYSITAAGRAELERWLAGPNPIATYRDPLLIQLFFGALLENEDLLTLVEARTELHQQRRAGFEAIPTPPLDETQDDRMRTLIRLTVELGLMLDEAYLNWLDLCRTTIEAMPQRGEDHPRPFGPPPGE